MSRLESIIAGLAAGCFILLAVHNICMALLTADPVRHEAARAILEVLL